MNQIRKRLTYANVMSSIAVFLVLGGGTALALGANTVGTAQLQKNAVKVGKIGPEAVKAGKLAKNAVPTNRIRNNAVSAGKIAAGSILTDKLGAFSVTADKIAPGAVTSEKIANDAVTGDKVKESTLGTVPNATNAQQLDGAPAASYAKSQLEAIHVIGGPGEPGFEHGCANNSVVTFGEAGFYKDGFGIVHLVGLLSGCTAGSSMFTLPAGFRPAVDNLMVVAVSETTSGEVGVLPSGEVKVFGGAAPRLFGLTFRTN